MSRSIRNVAIIAHVDHGKTTLVDELLQQSGTFGERDAKVTRVMDSNDLEKERGITILAKNTAIHWKDTHINIVDTPGHADFGGEVERILSMVDSVLLVVDANEGPMPQTRFVTQKAFEYGLKPIVVINKVDRPSADPDRAIDLVFDLFVSLNANDAQLDFPVVYASALQGWAALSLDDARDSVHPLLDVLVDRVSPPDVDENGPLQMQISALDYSSYVGTIGIGRIKRGSLRTNMPMSLIDRHGKTRSVRLAELFTFLGLERQKVESAHAGDIVAVTGIDPLNISDTLCDPDHIEALPALDVDEPTMRMIFQVNDSPFAGKEGKFVTGRHLRERLERELITNVALSVEPLGAGERFRVSGRGELHLSILIETMRREGYELAVSRPEVITKEIDGQVCEPFEHLVIDVEMDHQGGVMQALAERHARVQNIEADAHGRVQLTFIIATRALIGFHTRFLTLTSGSGLIYHTFDHFAPMIKESFATRQNGVLVSNSSGDARAYAIWNLESRGRFFIPSNVPVYEGMIVAIHSRDNDLVVNPCKEKQLTNIRASGSDENITLTPHLKYSLEQYMTFLEEDELLEITPSSLRLRKKYLKEHERKRAGRERG